MIQTVYRCVACYWTELREKKPRAKAPRCRSCGGKTRKHSELGDTYDVAFPRLRARDLLDESPAVPDPGGDVTQRDAKQGLPEGVRGKSVPHVEVERRLAVVSDIMSSYRVYEDVVREARAKLGIGKRTTDRYVAKVRERWQATRNEDIASARARHAANLARIRVMAEKQGQTKTAAMVAKTEAELDGCMRQQIAVTMDARVAVADLTDEELVARATALGLTVAALP